MILSDQTHNNNLIHGKFTYLLIFLSACFPNWAKYFYMIYRLIIGSLYPTYLSYKALKQKDEKECIRLIMYWIVFSVFSFFEGFLDIFLGFWLPFYYESKLIFIFWLISPYGNGAKILYENFVNKKFEEHEEAIDECINNLKQFSINTFWKLWDKFSFYLNRLLILSITRAHMAAVQYVHNQHNPYNLRLKSSISTVEQLEEVSTKPLIEEMETENEDHGQVNQDIPIEKTLRKTKRKRRIIIEDISNRPVTRSSTAKAWTSEMDNNNNNNN